MVNGDLSILWEDKHSLLAHTLSLSLLLNVELRRIVSTSCLTMKGDITIKILFAIACGVFNMRNGMITPLSPKIAAMQTQGNKTVCQEQVQVSWASMEKKTECQGRPAWFFHAEAM